MYISIAIGSVDFEHRDSNEVLIQE
jgi:hypothetical protein